MKSHNGEEMSGTSFLEDSLGKSYDHSNVAIVGTEDGCCVLVLRSTPVLVYDVDEKPAGVLESIHKASTSLAFVLAEMPCSVSLNMDEIKKILPEWGEGNRNWNGLMEVLHRKYATAMDKEPDGCKLIDMEQFKHYCDMGMIIPRDGTGKYAVMDDSGSILEFQYHVNVWELTNSNTPQHPPFFATHVVWYPI